MDHPEDTERNCQEKVRQRQDNREEVPREGAVVTKEL